MAQIWKAVDSFPIESSTWHPYWENRLLPESSKIKISYYKAQNDTEEFLVFVSNPTDCNGQIASIQLTEKPVKIFSVKNQA